MKLVILEKNEKTPIYLQIVDQIKKCIFSGSIADGYRLPSERSLAKELGVHRNTVTKAYNELKAEDLIESHQGKSYRVSFRQKYEDGLENEKRKDVNWEALMYIEDKEFTTDFDELYARGFDKKIISFAGGVAAREAYPIEEIADMFERVLKDEKNKTYFYTPFQGEPQLRNEIASYMAAKGIEASPSNVQIFAENNQSLDFILDLILKPGDRVITGEAMSADIYRTIRLAGGEVINIPGDDSGIICDNLEVIIQKYNPKLIYVDSSFNNPRGTILPVERRQMILNMSYKYRIPIIEDDEGSELYYDIEPIPSLKSMDRGNNVIYMYSFSLTMIPGTGISFVIADNRLINQLQNMVSLRIANPNWASQMLMLEYMKSGLFHKRLQEFRDICRRKRDLMCLRLDELVDQYGLDYRKPEGGVFLWVRLPSRINARVLLKHTQKMGMTFMPGYLFFSSKSIGKNYLRLNYSYPTMDEIHRGMDIFEKAIAQVLE